MALSKVDPNSFDVNSIGQYGGRRNLAINGAMQIAQRQTSISGRTSTGIYAADRFGMALSSFGTWTISQETDAPTGFKYSNKWLCTTANASPTSSQYGMVYQAFETRDFRGIGYGSSDAKNLTISFWVKSNKTGNASVGAFFYDDSNNYFHSKQYTINSADTWEYKTVTMSPNTSNSLRTPDEQQGFTVEWFLGGGSNYTGGSHDSWSTSQTNRNVSNIGIGTAVNDYLQLTGVQIEIGDIATPFEHRSYAEELALCQRYYERIQDYSPQSQDTTGSTSTEVLIGLGLALSSTRVLGRLDGWKVTKRVPPTVSISDDAQIQAIQTGAWYSATNTPNFRASIFGCRPDFTHAGSFTAGGAVELRFNNDGTNAYIEIDAEL